MTANLQGFPLLKCGFDRQKISMLAVFGMLFEGGPSPGESTTRCRTNRVFSQDVSQRLSELRVSILPFLTIWPLPLMTMLNVSCEN